MIKIILLALLSHRICSSIPESTHVWKKGYIERNKNHTDVESYIKNVVSRPIPNIRRRVRIEAISAFGSGGQINVSCTKTKMPITYHVRKFFKNKTTHLTRDRKQLIGRFE